MWPYRPLDSSHQGADPSASLFLGDKASHYQCPPRPRRSATGTIGRVTWELGVGCLRFDAQNPPPAGISSTFNFHVEQEPPGRLVHTPYGPQIPGTIVSDFERADSVAFTFQGQVQANWCIQVTVNMTGGPDVTSPYVFASEHPDSPGIALFDLPFILSQNTDGSLAINPAFRHSTGCLH